MTSEATAATAPVCGAEPVVLRVENASASFMISQSRGLRQRRKELMAVRDVSFELRSGQTLGLVGESGSGKSTLARMILGLGSLKSGRISIAEPPGHDQRLAVAQTVFQDSSGALDPRMTVLKSVAEPLRRTMTKPDALAAASHWLTQVGLPEWHHGKYPRQLSGGQRQRVNVARAIAPRPSLLVADEPLSALDVSLQAQLVEIFSSLRDELGLTMIFVSHDLGVVRHITDVIAVMYLGEMIEFGPTEEVFQRPRHPYTRALLDSIPDPESDIEGRFYLEGEIPSAVALPRGCVFHTRCPSRRSDCSDDPRPPLQPHPAGGWSKCLYPLN